MDKADGWCSLADDESEEESNSPPAPVVRRGKFDDEEDDDDVGPRPRLLLRPPHNTP